MSRPLISKSVVLKQHYCDIHYTVPAGRYGQVMLDLLEVPAPSGYDMEIYPETERKIMALYQGHVRVHGESFAAVMEYAIDVELAIAAAGGSVITQ